MPEIVLSEEQSQVVRQAEGVVVVRDSSGDVCGSLYHALEDSAGDATPPVYSTEEKLEILRRMSQENIRWSTTAEVIERIRQRVGR